MKIGCVQHYYISELWEASPAVFISILVGIIYVIISIITGYEIPSSGGVLVGAALIAEVLLQKSAWLYAAQIAGLNSVAYKQTGRKDKDGKLCRSKDGTPEQAFHIVTLNTIIDQDNTDNEDGSYDQDRCDTDDYLNPEKYKILETLYRNAKETEKPNSSSWQLHATAFRIKNILSDIILIASLSGTAIWAFAHLLKDPCCNCLSGC